jgi:ATP-dependent DNA ligase
LSPDWTERYQLIRDAVAALRPSSATIDGEAVCCDEAGVEHLEGDGAAIFAHACKFGAEGIVSKHR